MIERGNEVESSVPKTKTVQNDEPLFITKVVKTNGSDVAKTLSKVKLPEGFPEFEAHSGYITVNQDYDSNLFFFFVKAENDPENKLPLTLWMEGGPGFSGLLGMFNKNGPVGITADGSICARLKSLHENAHVIYLDAPVGGGFSFTRNTTLGLSSNLNDTSKNIAEFLRQFLNVFPEHKSSNVYVAGESYGGRLAVGFAHYVAEKAKQQPNGNWPASLNLKGVIAGSPFLGPVLDTIDSSDFLFSVGMLNESTKKEFKEAFQKIKNETSILAKLKLLLGTVFQDYSRQNLTLFQKLTGYNFHASVMHPKIPQQFVQYKKYVNSSEFKTAIHVGSEISLRSQIESVVGRMGMGDFFTDITAIVEEVFNKYKVLLYGGQLDTIFPVTNMEKFYNGLNWDGSEEFRRNGKVYWYNEKDPDFLNGYVTKGGKVTYALLVGSGHDPGFDVPEATYELTKKFLKEQEIVQSRTTA